MNKKLYYILAFFIIGLFAIWLYGLNLFVETLPKQIKNEDTYTEGIVILTGGSKRLETGIALLNEGKAEKLFISGVGNDTKLESMLILSGELPDNIADIISKIELGYQAQNTKGNAIEVANWVQDNNYKTIRLVTSNYHIDRSILEIKKQLPDIQIIAHPVSPENFEINNWWKHSLTRNVLILEYNKLLITKIFSFV